MILPGFVVCSLILLAAVAALPTAAEVKNAALVRAAPVLTRWISGAELAQGGDDIAGIVVLGGSLSRVREAIGLAMRYPKATVLLTGPGSEEKDLATSHGAISKRLVLDLRARNTFENAWFSKSLAQPHRGQRWVLVTSAIHMPRAFTVFCSVGFKVEPWSVQDMPAEDRELAHQVQHELLGLLAYRLLGRTNVLVTSPGRKCV